MSQSPPIQSIMRAVNLLSAVADSTCGANLADLAEQTGLKRPTAHNLLRSLVEAGALRRSAGGTYHIGRLVQRWHHQGEIQQRRAVIDDCLLQLAQQEPQWTWVHADIVNDDLVSLARIGPEHRGRLIRPHHRPLSLYHSACGLATLAFADEITKHALEDYRPFAVYGVPYWKSHTKLNQELQKIKASGLCQPDFPDDPRILAAIPFFNNDHSLLGVIGGLHPKRDHICSKKAITVMKELVANLQHRLNHPNEEATCSTSL